MEKKGRIVAVFAMNYRPTAQSRLDERLEIGRAILREAGAKPYDERAADEYHLRTTAEASVDVNGILGVF